MRDLNKIIESFLLQYTFNNIDILLSHRKILSLEKEALKDKIVVRQRGGYCFENNQHFFNVLKDKGYDVTRALGRVVYGKSNEVPRTHQLTVVTLEGKKYIADVGFGPYTPGGLVPFDGSNVTAFNGSIYRVAKLNDVDYELQTLRGSDYFSLYQFNLADYKDADFKISNYYTNTHPESKFTTSLMLSQLHASGVKFISNLTFTFFEGVERKDVEIKSASQLNELVKTHFGVRYSEVEMKELFEIVKNFK